MMENGNKSLRLFYQHDNELIKHNSEKESTFQSRGRFLIEVLSWVILCLIDSLAETRRGLSALMGRRPVCN